MKHVIDLSYALVISLILTAFTFAQEPEKPQVVMTQQAPKMVSLKILPASEKFTSPEGRFTIAMPKDIAEFEALKPTPESPKETGGKYTWVVKEGVISIDYSDDPDLVIKTKKTTPIWPKYEDRNNRFWCDRTFREGDQSGRLPRL